MEYHLERRHLAGRMPALHIDNPADFDYPSLRIVRLCEMREGL